MSRVHDLKTWPEYFRCLADGSKTFEIRRNDRGFREGDTLLLREYDAATGRYTGRELTFAVGFVAEGSIVGLGLGDHVVMSLVPSRTEGSVVSDQAADLYRRASREANRMTPFAIAAMRELVADGLLDYDSSKFVTVPARAERPR